MKLKTYSFLLVVLAALVLPACGRGDGTATASQEATVRLDWMTDFAAAKAKAKAENKMVFMDFTGSDWCPPCKLLQKEVFTKPEFAEYAAKHLVLLEVDFPRRKQLSPAQRAANEKLQDEFGIDGYPTIVVLESSGEPLGKLGYMPGGPQAFIEVLEKARTMETKGDS